VNQLVQVSLQTPRARVIGFNNDGHARDARFFRAPDGQRIDVECTATEQRRHPRQHSRFVFDIYNERVQHGVPHASAAVSTSTLGRRIIWCRSAPAATIGYTVSSCSTWKSISTGPSWSRAA